MIHLFIWGLTHLLCHLCIECNPYLLHLTQNCHFLPHPVVTWAQRSLCYRNDVSGSSHSLHNLCSEQAMSRMAFPVNYLQCNAKIQLVPKATRIASSRLILCNDACSYTRLMNFLCKVKCSWGMFTYVPSAGTQFAEVPPSQLISRWLEQRMNPEAMDRNCWMCKCFIWRARIRLDRVPLERSQIRSGTTVCTHQICSPSIHEIWLDKVHM